MDRGYTCPEFVQQLYDEIGYMLLHNCHINKSLNKVLDYKSYNSCVWSAGCGDISSDEDSTFSSCCRLFLCSLFLPTLWSVTVIGYLILQWMIYLNTWCITLIYQKLFFYRDIFIYLCMYLHIYIFIIKYNNIYVSLYQ